MRVGPTTRSSTGWGNLVCDSNINRSNLELVEVTRAQLANEIKEIRTRCPNLTTHVTMLVSCLSLMHQWNVRSLRIQGSPKVFHWATLMPLALAGWDEYQAVLEEEELRQQQLEKERRQRAFHWGLRTRVPTAWAPPLIGRDYVSTGRKTFLVEMLPEGALPVRNPE